jgi:hypothetical protein
MKRVSLIAYLEAELAKTGKKKIARKTKRPRLIRVTGR